MEDILHTDSFTRYDEVEKLIKEHLLYDCKIFNFPEMAELHYTLYKNYSIEKNILDSNIADSMLESLYIYYNNVLNKYEYMLFNEGVCKKDYFELVVILKELKRMYFYLNKDCDDLIRRLLNIKNAYEENILSKTSLKNYVRSISDITHLIFTNNGNDKIVTSPNGAYFICQFHKEKSPSLKTWYCTNTANCFGCGLQVNPISYIMTYENVSFKQAISLLCDIYLIRCGKDYVNEELIKKYHKSLISDEYLNILNSIYEKAICENTPFYDDIASKVQSKISICKRVKNGIYDSYDKDNISKALILK